MEKDAARQERGRRRAAALSVAAAALSVASVAFCVLLSINAAELRNRVLDLENPQSAREEVDSVVERKVKQLLTQVSRRQAGGRARTVNEKCVSSRFSACSRTTSRSGPRDKPHLNATAPQVSCACARVCMCARAEVAEQQG